MVRSSDDGAVVENPPGKEEAQGSIPDNGKEDLSVQGFE